MSQPGARQGDKVVDISMHVMTPTNGNDVAAPEAA
jgi:hypothetical protein